MKANEWLERGNKETDPINAFSNFWRGFNNLFSRIEEQSERQKIRAYIGKAFSEKSAFELLEASKSNVHYLMSQPVINMRGNGKNTTSNIEAFNLAKTSLEKLQEVFMVIYQIRCNLEHGEKSPNRERDIELCKNSAPFVAFAISQNA